MSRLLRTYERMAQIDHGSCDRCYNIIFPGDFYRGEVYVSERTERRDHRITVRKFHVNPLCPLDDPFEDERNKDRENFEDGKEDYSLPLAA